MIERLCRQLNVRFKVIFWNDLSREYKRAPVDYMRECCLFIIIIYNLTSPLDSIALRERAIAYIFIGFFQ